MKPKRPGHDSHRSRMDCPRGDSVGFDETFDTAVERMMDALGDQISLLGIGDPFTAANS